MSIVLSDLSDEDRKFLLKETARQFAADLREDCEGLEEVEVAGLLRLDPRTVRKLIPFKEVTPGVRRYPRKSLRAFLETDS